MQAEVNNGFGGLQGSYYASNISSPMTSSLVH